MRKILHRMENNGIRSQFRAIMRKCFEPVSKLTDEHRNIYYYRPEPSRSFQSSNNSPYRGNSDIVKLLEVANTPLFIRMECTFRKTNLHQTEHTHLPILNIPTSYIFSSTTTVDDDENRAIDEESDDDKDLSALDFTPHIIGTDQSPIESLDGTVATLHLVCLTTPDTDKTSSSCEATYEII